MEYFLARQPIFNENLKVIGYELFSRSGFDRIFKKPENYDRATSRIITEGFFVIGPDSLTDGKRAFIHFSRNFLLSDMASLLPGELVAVEITGDVYPSRKLLSTCQTLKNKGYLIVLDDFVFQQNFIPLLELADYVKVDFAKTGDDIKKSVPRKVGSNGVRCLMKNVPGGEAYYQALEMGYQYFEGDFFRRPFILAGRDVPGYKLNYLQILKELHRPDVDIGRVERIIKQDMSLSFKLLKLVNSAAFGFLTEIKSIRQALVLLGLKEIKKWATLLAISNMSDEKPVELVKNSLIRARFCESVANHTNIKGQSSELFLMGLFSLIDAIIDQPFYSILEDLPLSRDIKSALLGGESPYRNVYDLILAYEKADWQGVSKYAGTLTLDEQKLPHIFLSSIRWVDKIFR